MAEQPTGSFEAVQARLNQIVDEVSAEDISLDDALKLYEEAVKLGLSACDLSEQDIDAFLSVEEAPEGAETAEAQAAAPPSAAEVAADGRAGAGADRERSEESSDADAEADPPASSAC